MNAMVNPTNDPAVDDLWDAADADSLGRFSRFAKLRRFKRRAWGRGGRWGRAKFLRAVRAAKQRGGPRAALAMARKLQVTQLPAIAPSVIASPAFMRKLRVMRPAAVPPGIRRRRRLALQRKRAAMRTRMVCRRVPTQIVSGRGGLSGFDDYELEGLAGLPDDAPFTLGDDLGDLDGFFKKIKRRVKKHLKKTLKVVKKVVKSKAFKFAAIAAVAWFAGPMIVAKLAAKKGIAMAVARAALKRGAQRLGKTSATVVGVQAATNAAPAPGQVVDYEAIMELGLVPDNQAAATLAPAMLDSRTYKVPGEIGGPKLAGFGKIGAIVIGGGMLVAVMMGGIAKPRRRRRR